MRYATELISKEIFIFDDLIMAARMAKRLKILLSCSLLKVVL